MVACTGLSISCGMVLPHPPRTSNSQGRTGGDRAPVSCSSSVPSPLIPPHLSLPIHRANWDVLDVMSILADDSERLDLEAEEGVGRFPSPLWPENSGR